MSYRAGDIFYKEVTTFNVSGISTNTDITPWATLTHNGLDDFSGPAHVFVTSVDIGRYVTSGVIPVAYSTHDSVSVVVSGLVSTYLSKTILELGSLDQLFPSVNVVQFSGVAVAGANLSGAILSDMRYIQGNLVLPYNGIARSGTANTIQLAASEPGTDNYYKNVVLQTVGGTGPNEFGIITSYSGASQTAYMDRNFSTIPYNDTQYSFIGYGRVNDVITAVAFTGTTSVTGVAPANFLGLGSIYPGVTVSVTGLTLALGTVSVTGSAPANFLGTNSVVPGFTVSVTGTLPLAQLSSAGLDLVVVEPGVNARQALSINNAATAGVSSGAGNTIWYQGVNNPSQNRIAAIATSGIRTSISYIIP